VARDAPLASRERGFLSTVAGWPGAAGRKLFAVVPRAVEDFFAHRCTLYAAGIAYRILFSLAPLAIVLVSIFGLVLRDESVRHDVINEIVGFLPFSSRGSKDVENAIVQIATPAGAIGFVSILVFAWAASGMMGAIRTGLEAALGVGRSRPAARNKLVDLILVVGAAVLVLAVAGLGALGDLIRKGIDRLAARTGIDGGLLEAFLRHALPFALTLVVVLLLYRFVPARRLRLRDALAGAVVTALMLLGISLLSGYIYTKTTKLSVVYGSLTAAFVFLYSVYLYAVALLFGASVAAAWSLPPGPSGGPLLQQVKNLVVGLFVRRQGDEPPPS
jgi:membrane protein